MNSFQTLLLITVGVFFLVWMAILISKNIRRERRENSDIKQTLEAVRQELQLSRSSITSEIHLQSGQNLKFLNETQGNYQKTIGGVENRLGQLQQATAQMIEMAKDLSALQNILQHPKLRGGMGEFLLDELLSQVLPADCYDLQYSFSDGVKVDAALRLGDGIVPIDSKFPLENFQRMLASEDDSSRKSYRRLFAQDVKKHCDDIAAKYIRPGDETLDFALMFIPAEYVYYEAFLAADEETRRLQDYALKKKVLAVSPQGFYAYIQIVARGLKGLRIEKAAQQILDHINQLEIDFGKAFGEFDKVGNHLKNAQSAYERNQRQWLNHKEALTALSTLKKSEQPAPLSEEALP